MTDKKKTRIFIIIFLLCSIGYVIWGFWSKWQLDKNHIITTGTIYKYNNGGGRGNAGRFFVDFRFWVNGKEHSASSGYQNTDFNCTKDFIDRTFPIIYNPDHPSISSVLIIPSDFARFNIPFPDSLKWVKQFIK